MCCIKIRVKVHVLVVKCSCSSETLAWRDKITNTTNIGVNVSRITGHFFKDISNWFRRNFG